MPSPPGTLTPSTSSIVALPSRTSIRNSLPVVESTTTKRWLLRATMPFAWNSPGVVENAPEGIDRLRRPAAVADLPRGDVPERRPERVGHPYVAVARHDEVVEEPPAPVLKVATGCLLLRS